MINPHGSSGMGQDFQDAVKNNWGGVPFKDLMLGLDYVIAHYPVDGKKINGCGASYGFVIYIFFSIFRSSKELIIFNFFFLFAVVT